MEGNTPVNQVVNALQPKIKGMVVARDHNNYSVSMPVKDIQMIVYDNDLGIYITLKGRLDTVFLRAKELGIEEPNDMHKEYINLITFWGSPEDSPHWPVYAIKDSLQKIEA